MGQQESKKERSLLLALLLFVGAGLLLFMSLESPKQKTSEASARERIKGPEWEKKVNHHLFSTNEDIDFQRQKMQIENRRLAPEIYNTRKQNAYKDSNQGVDLSTDSRGYEIANELGRGSRENGAPQTPHEVVQGEIFNEQQRDEYTDAYKKEYARQFVENARRGGYDVKLSDDFKVLSVRPLRRPSQTTVDPLYNTIDSSNQ
jgi:hypothetical protein